MGSAFGAMSEALPAAERGVRPRAASLHAPGRGQAQPAAERAMLAQIRSRFVRRNERLLRAYDSAAVDACLAAQSLSDLLAAHVRASPGGGRESSRGGGERRGREEAERERTSRDGLSLGRPLFTAWCVEQAPFAMRRRGATGDEYFAAHDPMAVRRNVSVPVSPLSSPGDAANQSLHGMRREQVLVLYYIILYYIILYYIIL